jgi:hypothetical protein
MFTSADFTLLRAVYLLPFIRCYIEVQRLRVVAWRSQYYDPTLSFIHRRPCFG